MKPLRILSVILCLFIFAYCSESRKTQRAIQRVESNPKALDQVWAEIRELRPCVPDTIAGDVYTEYVEIPGPREDLAQERIYAEMADSAANTRCDIDTVVKGYHIVIRNGMISFYSPPAKQQVIHETKYIKDVEAEKFWKDSTVYKSATIAAINTTLHQREQQTDAIAKTAKTRLVMIWGLLAILALVIFIAIRKLF